MNKFNLSKSLILVIAFVLVAGSSFFGGIKFNQMRGDSFPGSGMVFDGPQGGGADMPIGLDISAIKNRGSMIAGEIVSFDDTTLTIKTPSGSSQTVYLSDSTEITKATTATAADLTVGAEVNVSSDGSSGAVTAKTIQIK